MAAAEAIQAQATGTWIDSDLTYMLRATDRYLELQAGSGMAVGLWVALIVLGLAVLYDVLRKRRGSTKLHLPPGPRGIPVLGSMSVFTGSRLPHHALTDLAKRYGPLLFLRLGSTPCLVASSPEVCKEVFKDQDQVFASRPQNSAVEHLMYRGRGLSFAPYGDHWRQMRKIATVELLTQRRIDQFGSFRVAEASAMVRAIHHDAVYGNGKAINLRVVLKALTFNFTTQICFGKRFFQYDSQAPTPPTVAAGHREPNEIDPQEAREFTHLLEEMFTLLGVQLIGDFIPYLSILDRFTGFKPRMIKCHKRLDEFLGRIVEEHRKHPNSAKPDFVDVLLGLPGKDGSQHLDDVTIKALCLDMVDAGTDTSSNALEWILAELVRHPEVAARLQAELDSVVGKERLVTEADIPNLPYLQAVVKEGLRLHPAGALNVPHESLQQSKLMGYDIPKSTVIFTNVWAMHRDPALWDNPMEFRPERFLDKPEIDVKGLHYQLLPFGTGRRGCPGMALGLTMVQYALARLIQSFQWSAPPGMKPQDVDIEESWGLTLPRAHALELVPIPRLPFLLY